MQSVRDSSQQDRRVYVGNLAYDVKWHHLKDFMRTGTFTLQSSYKEREKTLTTDCSWRGTFCRCAVAAEWHE